jgi:glycosyltransferase involved in cell wall biosynthesis
MISQHYPPHIGGYAVICADTATLLRARGHEVRVLTSEDECEEAEQDNNVRRVLRRREVQGYETARLRHAVRFLGDQRTFRRNRRTVCAEAKEFRADAAVVWQFESLGPDLVQGLQRDGVPTALNVGDAVVKFLKERLCDGRVLVWRIARRLFYRDFARELTRTPLAMASEAIRDCYIEAGFDARRMTVVPVAVWERNVASRPPAGGSGTRLLYVGRIHPCKGVDIAIRALALLNTPEPGRFTLDVSGTGAPDYVAALADLARALGVAASVRFLEPTDRDGLMRRYDEHDIGLVSSVWFEGGPITLVEAMSRGLAVVACDRGGPTSIVTRGVDGLLVTPESPEAFAEGVRRLAGDAALRRAMGERAIAKVREKFLLEDTAAQWEELLARGANARP